MTHVLVVDDDVTIREVVRDLLQDEGYTVTVAADGRHALEVIAGDPTPDLVLLDMRMPVLDGREFAQALEARGVRTPLIVMTAQRNPEEAARLVGATSFVAKPFDLDALLEAVRAGVAERV